MRGILPTEGQVSEVIRKAVDARGIRYPWLAAQLEISDDQLRRRLRGEARFTIPQVTAISRLLGMSEDDLLSGVSGRSAGNSEQHQVSPAVDGLSPEADADGPTRGQSTQAVAS